MIDAESLLVVALDPTMSPDAVRVALYFAAQGEGAHPYDAETFSLLLGGEAGDKRIRKALRRAEGRGYLTRQKGGRHSDRFTFCPPIRAGENLYPPPGGGEKNLSPAPGDSENASSRPLGAVKGAASSTTDTSPSTVQSTTRERTPETDLARLRIHLGEFGEAADLMCDAAEHSPTWAAAIYGKFGPNGTRVQLFKMQGIPPERWPAVLADAMTDWANDGKPYDNRHFEGYVRKAAINEQRTHGGGTGGEAGRNTSATGTDGPPRARIPIE